MAIDLTCTSCWQFFISSYCNEEFYLLRLARWWEEGVSIDYVHSLRENYYLTYAYTAVVMRGVTSS